MGIGADDLQMKLILDVMNNMSGKLDQAANEINQLDQSLQHLNSHNHGAMKAMNGSLLDPATWSALMKNSEAFQQRMDMLQMRGFNAMMTGGAILAPVVGAVKAAGDLQEVMNQIKVDIYDSRESTEQWATKTSLLRGTMVDLSREVKFSSADIGEAIDSLVRGNVSVQEVADGAGKAAVYLAQASKMATGDAAESVAKIANAWQLSGQQIAEVADTLARVDAASTATIPDLLEGMKYVSATASNLKVPVKDLAVSLGVLNNAGIDASTAGTTLNMLFQNLQPTTKAAKDAFAALGLSVKNNPFYDVNGKLKPMVDIIKVLRNATKDMTDEQKQLAFKQIFDERGSRAVISLLKEGKNSYEDVNSSLANQMSLWDRIKLQNEGLNSQVKILQTNITTLFAESGSPLGQELTGLVKKTNDVVVAMTEWSKANPDTTSQLLELAGGVGGVTLAVGALQVAVAALAKVWLPILATPEAGVAAIMGAAAYGLHKAAPYIPGTGDYLDRRLAEQQQAWDNRGEIAKIETHLSAAPTPWYKKINWFGPAQPGTSTGPAGKSPITINITARDAQETAQEVGRVVNSPDKYVQSRLPTRGQLRAE